jgi:hypothetical protein
MLRTEDVGAAPAIDTGHPDLEATTMKRLIDLSRRGRVAATIRLWCVFLGGATVATALIAALQGAEVALARRTDAATIAASRRPASMPSSAAAHARPAAASSPAVAFAPTFDDAARALRAGRHAEAYGRFVSLADEGDTDAAQIALLMHRFGRRLFASDWDASPEQVAAWTRWSTAAAQRELADLHAAAAGPGAGRDGERGGAIASRSRERAGATTARPRRLGRAAPDRRRRRGPAPSHPAGSSRIRCRARALAGESSGPDSPEALGRRP